MKSWFFIAAIVVFFILLWWFLLGQNRQKTIPPSPLPGSISQVLTPKKFDHIVLIVMENKSFQDIIGNSSAPFINNLAKSNTLVGNYKAVSHPSLPNYLAFLGGSTFGISSDCTSCFIDAPNLVDSLEKSHVSWKAYMESMPSPCYLGSTNLYAQKHDPFMYFNDIRDNPSRCKRVVPFSELNNDLSNNPPSFIFIIPNLCNDMHDCSISTGDAWLSREEPAIVKASALSRGNSLLIVTWDEDDNSSSNQVPLILISPQEKLKVSSGEFNHYSLLRSIEQNFGLGVLTPNDKAAQPLF